MDQPSDGTLRRFAITPLLSRSVADFKSHITGSTLEWTYVDDNRVGDHIWWIGDNGHFTEHYPTWEITYDVPAILTEMHATNRQRWS